MNPAYLKTKQKVQGFGKLKRMITFAASTGEMAERLNAAVLKTVDPLRGPWVRIPLSPQLKVPPQGGFFLSGTSFERSFFLADSCVGYFQQAG